MRLGKTNSLNNFQSQEVLVSSGAITGLTSNCLVLYSADEPRSVTYIEEKPIGTIINIVPKVSGGVIIGPIVTIADSGNINLNSSYALDSVTDTISFWYDGATWNQITAVGVQGSQGATGTQGSQGLQGAQGAEGAQGAQGAQGTPGLTGTQGAVGTQGAQGAQGDNGS